MQREAARHLLGVGPHASPSEVERAFRRQARRAHPDLGGDASRFRDLLEARALLAAGGADRGAAYRAGTGVARTRLVVRRSRAQRVLRALRSRFSSAPSRVR